jgi:plasmid maintenance system antidote protein VapI
MTTQKRTHSWSASKFLEKLVGPLSIAALIDAERKNREKTQVEFARLLGISAANLCDIAKKRKLVSPQRAAVFAKKLGKLEALWVEIATQDLLRASGLRYRVRLEALAKKSRTSPKVARRVA